MNHSRTPVSKREEMGPGEPGGMLATDLIFVMSFRSSLRQWHHTGLLDREILLLNSFIDHRLYSRVWVLSYDPSDHEFLEACKKSGQIRPELEVITPSRRFGRWTGTKLGALIYSLLIPLVVRHYTSKSCIVRTNQISGAWSAFLIHLIHRFPLVLRCGYSLSRRMQYHGNRMRAAVAAAIEAVCLKACDVCVVSSADIKRYYSRWTAPQRIVVNPTFVDIAVFRAKPTLCFTEPLLYVGRLEAVKNIAALIRACAQLGLPLHVYGDGSLRPALQALSRELGAAVEFKGAVPNSLLADVYQQHSVYVLPSLAEAMPKALIEAMGCGLVCISTPTLGGTELLQDGVTGYVSQGFDVADLVAVLRRAIGERRADIGANARRHVETYNSLEGFVRHERTAIAARIRPQLPPSTPLAAPG